jgi:hypothetical protein
LFVLFKTLFFNIDFLQAPAGTEYMLTIKDPETYLKFNLLLNNLLECELACLLDEFCVNFNYDTGICELFYSEPLETPYYADESLIAAEKYKVDSRNSFFFSIFLKIDCFVCIQKIWRARSDTFDIA